MSRSFTAMESLIHCLEPCAGHLHSWAATPAPTDAVAVDHRLRATKWRTDCSMVGGAPTALAARHHRANHPQPAQNSRPIARQCAGCSSVLKGSAWWSSPTKWPTAPRCRRSRAAPRAS